MSYAMQNVNVQGGPKKRVYKLMGIILSNLILYIEFFSLKDCLVNLKQMLTKNSTIPCICCHITFWNVIARKQAINDKL